MVVETVFGTIAGAVAGSAATALRDRYEQPVRFLTGRSICRSCHKMLRWFELVPIVSWLVLRGRCARCQAPIGWSMLGVEVATATIGALAPLAISSPWALVIGWILLIVSGAIVIADLEEQLIPDVLIYAAAPLSLVLGLLQFRQPLGVTVGAGVLAGLLLLGLWYFTRRQGIGLGDVKLATALGIGLGWLSLFMLWVAFTVGGAIGLVLLLSGRARIHQRIPFGPFLVGAYFVTLLIGHRVAAWYSWW